jgi:hypothetical protein
MALASFSIVVVGKHVLDVPQRLVAGRRLVPSGIAQAAQYAAFLFRHDHVARDATAHVLLPFGEPALHFLHSFRLLRGDVVQLFRIFLQVVQFGLRAADVLPLRGDQARSGDQRAVR